MTSKQRVPGKAWMPGAGWRCNPKEADKGRKPAFYFVILGQGENPDTRRQSAKLCRIEIPDEELRAIGYEIEQGRRRFFHGLEAHYSHEHLKKVAVYDPTYMPHKGGQ